MAETPERKGMIIASSMEGGGVLDLIQIIKLSYDELLTGGRPAGTLYQAFGARSGGAIPTVALVAPDPEDPRKPRFTATELVPIFTRRAQDFFKPIPMRAPKMFLSQFFNLVEKKLLDPDRKNAQAAARVQELCAELAQKVPPDWKKAVDSLSRVAGSRWLTTRDKKKAVNLCRELAGDHPDLKPHTDAIETILVQRETKGLLSTLFRREVMHAMDIVRNRWAHSFMFNPEVPKNTYHQLLGDLRLSDALRATYVYAYNLTQQTAELFMCRPSDFLSDDPNTPRTVSRGNDLLKDVIMGTTAHPFGYQPYITADSEKVLTDKGQLQPALSFAMDLWYHSPDDIPIKFTFHNTGDYLGSSDRKQDWKNLTADQKQERAKAIQHEYVEDGVLGHIMNQTEMSEQSRYVETVTNLPLRLLLQKRNGGEKDNIFSFTPRLVPRTPDEVGQMPSRDVLDASPENLLNIINAAFRMLREQQEDVLREHAMLIDNLHNLGQMSDEDYEHFAEVNRQEQERVRLSKAFKEAHDHGRMTDAEYEAAMAKANPAHNPYSIENFEKSFAGLVDELQHQVRNKSPFTALNLRNPF